MLRERQLPGHAIVVEIPDEQTSPVKNVKALGFYVGVPGCSRSLQNALELIRLSSNHLSVQKVLRERQLPGHAIAVEIPDEETSAKHVEALLTPRTTN